MARLIDDSGFVVDEAIWDGIRSPGAVADRIEKMKKERKYLKIINHLKMDLKVVILIIYFRILENYQMINKKK